jgi:hypothetical protein
VVLVCDYRVYDGHLEQPGWLEALPRHVEPGGFSNDIIVGFVGVNDIPLVHIFQKDL